MKRIPTSLFFYYHTVFRAYCCAAAGKDKSECEKEEDSMLIVNFFHAYLWLKFAMTSTTRAIISGVRSG